MKKRVSDLQGRLMKAALMAAVVVTLTWWTLLACGVWQAIEWASA